MRESAAEGSGSTIQTRDCSDGQMDIDEIEGTSSKCVSMITAVARTQVGARSVKGITKTTFPVNIFSCPLYDINRKMVAALSKAGSTFSVGEARTYDAWGAVRSQVGSDGKLRYRSRAEIPPNPEDRDEGNNSRLVGRNRDCANLGHKQDDESGLIYMRARYYEPSSGRFISEDVKQDGQNWLVYASNNSISKVDQDGKVATNETVRKSWPGMEVVFMLTLMFTGAALDYTARLNAFNHFAFLFAWFSVGLRSTTDGDNHLIGGILIHSMTFLVSALYSAELYGALNVVPYVSGPASKVQAIMSEYIGFLGLFMDLENIAGAHPNESQ